MARTYLPGDEIFLFGFSRGAMWRAASRHDRGLRDIETPATGRVGQGLGISPRLRSAFARETSRNPVALIATWRQRSNFWGCGTPLRRGLRESRVDASSDKIAAYTTERLCCAARLPRPRDRGASKRVHALSLDGPGAGRRAYRAGLVRRRAFRCRRRLHQRDLADIPLVWMAKKAERTGWRSIGPACPTPTISIRPRQAMIPARSCSRPLNPADLAGDPRSARRPADQRVAFRSPVHAGRRARKARGRHQ